MRHWLTRALWASVLGMGVAAGLARGAEELPPPLAVPPVAEFHPALPPGPLPPGVTPATVPEYTPDTLEMPPGKWPRFRQWLRAPTGCWTHHNLMGCGSLRQELTFCFGSCRAFFGEPCLKGPPPWPYPPPQNGAAGAPGYPGATAPGSCRCP